VRNEFYKDSNAIILVYDVTNKKSLDGLDMWLREANDNGIEIVPTFIIGNKVIFIIGIIKHYIF
jgi:GTPase SAR1 family protein